MQGILRNQMWAATVNHIRRLSGFSALAPKTLSSIIKLETLTHATPEEVASIWENVSVSLTSLHTRRMLCMYLWLPQRLSDGHTKESIY